MNFSRIPRDVSRALYILIRSRLYSRAAGTRMRQHPVPSRAAWTYLRAGVLICSRLISFVIYKESTLFFGCLFWLHQWGIPRHTCRFYCCLAAHQRTRKKDSAEPSFPILWTPPHPPGESAAAGKCRLPRVYTNLGSCIPVLSLLASSECCAAICVRAGIARVSVGLPSLYRSFFIIGGRDCSCLRLRWVLLFLS